MSRPNERRRFFRRISDNLEHVDKETLLSHLVTESESHDDWLHVFDRLEEGILIVSPQGDIDFLNAAAKQILDLAPGTAKPFWRSLGDADLKNFFETEFPKLSSQISQTIRVLNPRERSLKVRIIPEIFQTPRRHLINIIDLTDPISPEMERLSRNRFESLIRLAGGLAHEIGNPLNAISLHSEILKKQIQKLKSTEKEKLSETIEIIQDEIQRLDRIVRSFLKSTRRAPLRFQMKDLCAIITDVARVLKPTLEEHAIRLELDLPEPVQFFLDEERIRSMLINLIQNSIESMPQGGDLRIQVQQQGHTVRIQIQDWGQGIAPEDLPRIFDAYFTTKEHGSGLGLLFVYDTITDHGGKIKVKSKLGQGTRFEILMPLRRTNLQLEHPQNQKTGEKGHVKF